VGRSGCACGEKMRVVRRETHIQRHLDSHLRSRSSPPVNARACASICCTGISDSDSKCNKPMFRTRSTKQKTLPMYASLVLCFLVFTCRLCMYPHTRGPVIYPLSIKH
jgi:hypothetical protein